MISLYTHNANGSLTDTMVKKGKNGTAYYTQAADYGDGDGDSSGQDYAQGNY
ncbi:MAG: hypothetical protein R3C11_27255 [Planctomycetaceae bacterium]